MDFLDFNTSAVSSVAPASDTGLEKLIQQEQRLTAKGKYLEAEKVFLQIQEFKRT
jgi:hypothetical protein